MSDNIKTAARIAGLVLLKWLLVVAAGCAISLICAAIVLFKSRGMSGGGHGSAWGYMLTLFSIDTAGFMLLFGAPLFMVLYIIVANKTAILSMVHEVLRGKAGGIISGKVGELVEGLAHGGTGMVRATDAAMMRVRLLQANMNNPGTSKPQRRVIRYGLKKMRLDDIDFQRKDLDLGTLVVGKMDQVLQETSKPSLKLFWLLVLVQTGLLLWSILFTH